MTVIAHKKEETETIVNATEWVEIISVPFGQDRNVTDDYFLLGYCEYAIANKNATVSARLLFAGQEVASDSFKPSVAGQFHSFSPLILVSVGLGVYYLTLEVKGSSIDDIVVRRKRLLIIKH